MKKDWYSPGSFLPGDRPTRFSLDQINWIADHYEVIIDGEWPVKTSGYIDNPFAPPSKGAHAVAYFETPMAVLAEFHWRTDRCGPDGEAFICVRCLQYEELRVIRLMRIDARELERMFWRVTAYIKGGRKDRPYTEFLRHFSPGYRGAVRHKPPPP